MEIHTRKPEEDDLSKIRLIFSDWYMNQEGTIQNDEVNYWTNKVEKSIKKEIKMDYLVAVNDKSEICGIIGWRGNIHKILTPYTKKKAVELYDLFILKKYQNTGIGKNLIKNFLEKVKNEYEEVVFVSAERWKEAWGFYDKLGFNRVGTTELNGNSYTVFQKSLT